MTHPWLGVEKAPWTGVEWAWLGVCRAAGGSGHYNPHVMFGTREAFISSLQIHAGCRRHLWKMHNTRTEVCANPKPRDKNLAIGVFANTIHIQLELTLLTRSLASGANCTFMLYNGAYHLRRCDRVKYVPVSLNMYIFSSYFLGSARLLEYSKLFKRISATQLTCSLAYYHIFQKISWTWL